VLEGLDAEDYITVPGDFLEEGLPVIYMDQVQSVTGEGAPTGEDVLGGEWDDEAFDDGSYYGDWEDELLADEPTGALDSKSSKQLMALFDELNKNGVTIIMITHAPEMAAYAKRVVDIFDGEISVR